MLTETVSYQTQSFEIFHRSTLDRKLNPLTIIVQYTNNYYSCSEFHSRLPQRTLPYWTLWAFITLVCMLTFYVQKDGHVDLWFSVHLTFVNAGVPLLNVFHPQVPLVRGLWVYHSEPRISCVCDDTGRQNVQVAFPHPWYLKFGVNIFYYHFM